MKTNRKHGFTIVELVVVIAIIAVLAAVLIPTFASIIKKANDSAYLQERTSQQIEDLAEKVENQNYLTWEDFEAVLARELAKVGSTQTADIEKAIKVALAERAGSDNGLSEAQVQKIINEAMAGQLTTAQVQAIVEQSIKNAGFSVGTSGGVTAAQVKSIVSAAIANIPTQTGVTPAMVQSAVASALANAQVNVSDQAIENALKAFGVSTLTEEQIVEIATQIATEVSEKTGNEKIVATLNIRAAGNEKATLYDTFVAMSISDPTTAVKSITAGETILWDSQEEKFVLYKNGAPTGARYWTVSDVISDKWSTYYTGTASTISTTMGFDAGTTTSVTSVTYTNTTESAQNVVIRTNGGTLTVNAPLDTVMHYGEADSVNIVKVASASYHENGTVPFIQISQGRIELEATAEVNGIHVANVQTVDTNGNITKTEKTFSNDVVLTLNGNDVKLTRDTIGTEIATPVLVCEVQANANSDEYIWLVGDGTIENAKVYVTETNATPDTSVASTTTTENASAAAIAIANNATNTGTEEAPVYEVVDAGTSAENAQVVSALKGSGTEEDPFLIYDYATMQKISDFYDKGYYYFAVDMSKTDNGKIDCSGWVPVYLHGSFDGNGVKFTNVTACLFQTVGYQLQNENILLKDFDATMNVSSNGQYGAAALIKNIFNAGVTTFDNVKVHGYLEGFWNMGSFYNYGTTNYDDVGCDYEVVFNNCYSDATLVCASGNTIGGLFGHAYEGSGHSFTLRVNNTEYVGQMFLTTTSGKGNKYYGMTSDYYNSHNHFYFNGVEDTFDNGNSKNAGAYTNCTKITEVKATKGSNGYVVEKQANVSKIVVTITAQLTAYDANDVKIPNLSGITMTLSSKELTELDGSNIKVLDLFNSIDITNNSFDYAAVVSNNTLNIRLSSSANYQSGNIRLQVNQYDSTGSIVSAGTIDLVTSANANSEWIVK